MLIKIFNKTESIEKWKGVFVLCLANKKLEKTFIRAKAGKPRTLKGLGERSRDYDDKFLRDSVVVTVHTRNIGT